MATSSEIQQLYVAYFGRAADPAGLDYWVSTGITTKNFAAAMYEQPEFAQVNAGLSVSQQVNALYVNLFGRNADNDGLLYWTQQINTGKLTLASIANDLIYAANNSTAPQSVIDKTVLNNKTATAIAYTTDVRLTTASLLAYNPTSTTPWVTGAQLTSAVNYLATVTTTAPTAAATTAAVVAMTAITPPGQTFTLTTSSNSFTGGANGDSFDGSLAAGLQTLGSADVLNGAAGIDSLNAVLNTAASITPTLTSIETLTISSLVAATLNLVNSTGYTTLDSNGSTNVLTFSNISSTAPALKYTSSSSGVTFAYTAAAVASTTDSATLTLSDTTGGVVTIAGVETVNIVSTNSANTIDASGIAAATLNVSGTQNLALGTLSTSTTNLNAGAATGTLSATLGAVVNATITGSAGADTLTVTGATGTLNVNTGLGNDSVTTTAGLLATDTLNGGDGTDKLVSTVAMVDTTATATAFTNISNFETLEISDALANTVTTARVQAGLSNVTLASGGTGTINFEAGARTLNITTIALAAGGVTINDTGIATTDSLTIANTSTAALNVGGGRDLAIGGFETTTINSTGVGAATTLTFGAIGITPDTGGSATLNVSGNNSVQMAAVTATSASSLTINASGLTGTAALIQSAAPVRATITTGATNITGSANADTLFAATTGTTVDGGAGKDTINGGTLTDNLSGGLGDDTFIMAAVLTQTDTISGGDGTDVLSVTADTTDASFTNITSVERVTQVGTIALTLGALAAAAGVNRVTLGAVATVETTNVGSGFTNDLTVVMDTGAVNAEVVNATGYTKNLTIQTAAAAGFSTTGTYTGGSGTADKIVYDLTAGAITQAGNAGITAIESITTTGSTSNNLSVTLNDANIALTKTLTIDGSALTGGGILTVVGTAELDGSLIVIGSASADAITGTASTVAGDNLSGGTGADTFTMAANLTVLDTIAGGDGTDVLTISAATLDAAFTNVTSVETLTSTASVTLGAKASAAGITSVTETGTATVGSGFTNNLTVTLVGVVADVIATGYTGALTVKATDVTAGITADDTITGGSGTTDTLQFNNTTQDAVEAAADIANVTAIENFTVSGSTTRNASFTLGDANIAAAKSLTISGSNLTTGVLTVNGASESNGSLIVVGGGGADQITGTASTLGDNLSGGAGDDNFIYATANLTLLDTIAGGSGADTLTINNASTRLDSDFTNITGVETLTVGTGLAQTITLGALANASGLTTITGSTTGIDTVTVGAAFTNALRINLGVGAANDVIDGSASAAAINFRSLVQDIAAGDVLKGGSSTGDVLTLTIDTNAQTATTTLMAGVETINVVQGGTVTDDLTITMGANDTQIAAGKTLTVNATALTSADATLTFTGTASELDGSLSVTGGNGNDTITGGGFTDTLVGGIGVDVLAGGLSADNLTGGTLADTFVFSAVADSNSANTDTITDFVSGTDKIRVTLDYSTQTVALDINAVRTSAGVAGVTAAQDTLSAQRGQYIYDTTNSALFVNVNNDNLLTTLDYKINVNAASTASATIVDGDVNFVITGGSAADVITTGGGADTINMAQGDSVNGGAGVDTFAFAAVSTASTITGGTGADLATLFAGANTLTVGDTDGITITTSTGIQTFAGTGIIAINAAAMPTEALNISGTGAFTVTNYVSTGTLTDTSTSAISITLGARATGTLALGTDTTGTDAVVGTALTDTQVVTLTGSNDVTVSLGLGDLSAAAYTGVMTITAGGLAATGTNLIVAGTAADIIDAGGGADNITGGTGADLITLSENVAAIDRVIQAAAGDSGTFALNAGAVNSIVATSFDAITGFAAGDVLALAAYTGTAAANAADVVLRSVVVTQLTSVVAGGVIVGANQVGTIRGNLANGSFVGSGAGLDLMVTYDGDATQLTTALEAVILVGAGALTMSVTAGTGGLLAFA